MRENIQKRITDRVERFKDDLYEAGVDMSYFPNKAQGVQTTFILDLCDIVEDIAGSRAKMGSVKVISYSARGKKID